jgi:hypothetical protein
MAQRLVDVCNRSGVVIHTYPVTIDGDAGDADYQAKALEAAAHGRLVSPAMSARPRRVQRFA